MSRLYFSFFHEEFVKNNKNKIQLIFKNKEYKLCGSIREIDKDFQDNTIDVKLKVIGALTNLSYMFSGTEISYLGDISKLDTSKVTDMSYLFYENKFVHFDDGFAINWDTSNVKNMSYLFSESCALIIQLFLIFRNGMSLMLLICPKYFVL